MASPVFALTSDSEMLRWARWRHAMWTQIPPGSKCPFFTLHLVYFALEEIFQLLQINWPDTEQKTVYVASDDGSVWEDHFFCCFWNSFSTLQTWMWHSPSKPFYPFLLLFLGVWVSCQIPTLLSFFFCHSPLCLRTFQTNNILKYLNLCPSLWLLPQNTSLQASEFRHHFPLSILNPATELGAATTSGLPNHYETSTVNFTHVNGSIWHREGMRLEPDSPNIQHGGLIRLTQNKWIRNWAYGWAERSNLTGVARRITISPEHTRFQVSPTVPLQVSLETSGEKFFRTKLQSFSLFNQVSNHLPRLYQHQRSKNLAPWTEIYALA